MNKKTPELNEEFFEALTNNSFDIVSIISADGTILFENKASERILGYDSGARINRNAFDFVHPDDKEFAAEQLRELLENPDKPKHVELRYSHEDGSWRILEIKAQNLIGKPPIDGIIINSRDVGDKKDNERALRESRDKYKRLFEGANDAVFLADGETGVILDANPKAEELVGRPKSEIIGLHQSRLHPEEMENDTRESFEDDVARGPNTVYKKFTVLHKSGRKIPVEINPSNVEIDGKKCVYGIFRDISAAVKSEDVFEEVLNLYKQADEITLEDILERGLDIGMRVTDSEIGYVHFIDPKRKKISLQIWSKSAIENCAMNLSEHDYPIESAGVWADCARTGKPAIHNDYANYPNKKGIPEGHVAVEKHMSAPVFQDGEIVAIMGVGNKEDDYAKLDSDLLSLTASNVWNIYRRKKAERDLIESEGRYRQLVETSSDAIYLVDETGTIADANETACEIMKRTREDLIGSKIDTVDPNFPVEAFLDFWEKAPFEEQQIFETTHRDSCGKSIPIEISGKKFRIDSGVYYYGVARDITERKKAERDLVESERKFKALFEQSNVGSATTDLEGRIMTVNRKLCEMLEYSSEELTTLHVNDITHPDDIDKEYEEVKGVTTGERDDVAMEKRFVSKTGKIIWGLINTRAIRNAEGNIEFIIGSIADISELKKTEEALRESKEKLQESYEALQESDAEKDKYISVLAHDLKSPFGGMLGLIDILSDEYDSLDGGEINKIIGAIRETSKKTYDLLLNLLEWARNRREEVPVNPVKTNIGELLEKALFHSGEAAVNKEIIVETNVPENLYAKIDRDMIQSCFRNLLNNAIKYTSRGGAVRIVAEQKENDVEITFSDDGIGMDEKTLSNLFKIGKTKSLEGTEQEPGSGFGLLLCKEFVGKHGGDIIVESRLGEGSEFKVRLPIKFSGNE